MIFLLLQSNRRRAQEGLCYMTTLHQLIWDLPHICKQIIYYQWKLLHLNKPTTKNIAYVKAKNIFGNLLCVCLHSHICSFFLSVVNVYQYSTLSIGVHPPIACQLNGPSIFLCSLICESVYHCLKLNVLICRAHLVKEKSNLSFNCYDK